MTDVKTQLIPSSHTYTFIHTCSLNQLLRARRFDTSYMCVSHLFGSLDLMWRIQSLPSITEQVFPFPVLPLCHSEKLSQLFGPISLFHTINPLCHTMQVVKTTEMGYTCALFSCLLLRGDLTCVRLHNVKLGCRETVREIKVKQSLWSSSTYFRVQYKSETSCVCCFLGGKDSQSQRQFTYCWRTGPR